MVAALLFLFVGLICFFIVCLLAGIYDCLFLQLVAFLFCCAFACCLWLIVDLRIVVGLIFA